MPTFADGKKPTREIHVDPAAKDGGDGSAAHPFTSLRGAVDAAKPGTAVILHPGHYPYTWLENVVGSADGPIWLGGIPGEKKPLFDDKRGGLHIARARYLVLHDIEVTGNPDNGINIDDDGDEADAEAARFIIIKNLDIHHIGGNGNQDCLKLSGLSDFAVVDSSFGVCGGDGAGSGIDMVGCHRGVLANNHVYDIAHSGFQMKGGSEDLLAIGNRFDNGGLRVFNMGGSTSFPYFRPPLDKKTPAWEAHRLRVIGNQIVGGTAAISFVGCVECVAANNTIVDPEGWPVRILQETTSDEGYTFLPSSKNRFVNNLIYFRRGKLEDTSNVGPNTAPDTFVFAHNLWFAHDAPDKSTPKLPVAEDGGVIGKDPMLAAPPKDLRPCGAGSPASGAGIDDPDVLATGRFTKPLPIGALAPTDCGK
jgi:hypothetical protein